MVFSSILFLFFFLPALLACYFCLPRRLRAWRNGVLLAFSLLFYACGGLSYLPVLLCSIAVNYLCGLLAAPGRPRALRRAGLWGAAVLGLGLLGVWLAMFADWIVRSAVFLVRFLRGRWKDHQVI